MPRFTSICEFDLGRARLECGLIPDLSLGLVIATDHHRAAFYTREELGKRNAGWYSMVAISGVLTKLSLVSLLPSFLADQESGAFSGLLAFGLFRVHTALKGWQLLFIIEGGATVIMAIVA